jgi:hypothetical protein
MSFGITKTIPAKSGIETLNALYDGSRDDYEFHMAGAAPTRLKVGDYVYTIFGDMLHGRLKIQKFITGSINPASGKPRVLVIVKSLGERLVEPISKKGHRGTRYTDRSEWTGNKYWNLSNLLFFVLPVCIPLPLLVVGQGHSPKQLVLKPSLIQNKRSATKDLSDHIPNNYG